MRDQDGEPSLDRADVYEASVDTTGLSAGRHIIFVRGKDSDQNWGAFSAIFLGIEMATVAPTVTGTARVGETLTADTSDIEDDDGLDNVAYSYQWIRSDGGTDSDIPDATGVSYTLTAEDVGKTVKVQVSFTDDAGNAESLTSDATEAVQPKPNTPADGQPTISGTAQVGETLTADTAAIEDDDGLDEVAYGYQWIANDDSTYTDILDATDSTYTISGDQLGKTIKVTVSFTDDAGNEETLTSDATEAVQPKPNTPADGQPTISGAAQVGETLTADTAAIEDDDGLDDVSYGYQWIANDDGTDTDILDATDSTYTISGDHLGKTIKVKVSFADDAGNEESLTSDATETIVAADSSGDGDLWSATLTVGAMEGFSHLGYGRFHGVGTLSPGTFSLDGTEYEVRALAHDAGTLYFGLDKALAAGFTLSAAGTEFASGDATTTEGSYTYLYQWPKGAVGWSEGDEVTVSLTASDEPDADDDDEVEEETDADVEEESEPLTVALENAAATHDGSATFTFDLRFSEEFDLSYKTLKFHAFDVIGGQVLKAKRQDTSSNILWRITVQPDSDGDVSVVLPATEDCDADGAICAEDGRKLSNSLEFTVSGPGE